MDLEKDPESVIYLAGGCFWGTEHLMQSIPGVIDAMSGYANGSGEQDARYQTVKAGGTGFKETVRVEYDPEKVSLDALLFAYFYVVDPTVRNRQGNDIGTQYQAGIYYTNPRAEETVRRIAALEKGRCSRFCVEIGPLINFYPAEEYHQNYLEKNPGGYCHIPWDEMALFSHLRIDPGRYRKPPEAVIRASLSEQQYRVIREGATEPSFANAYYDEFREGIYTDIVTGEPLFSSRSKYKNGSGQPVFSAPIELPVLAEREDRSSGTVRTEVRSRAGDSHLGHVFPDPKSPSGTCYCICSAALRFIPKEKMEAQGYGYLLSLFD